MSSEKFSTITNTHKNRNSKEGKEKVESDRLKVKDNDNHLNTLFKRKKENFHVFIGKRKDFLFFRVQKKSSTTRKEIENWKIYISWPIKVINIIIRGKFERIQIKIALKGDKKNIKKDKSRKVKNSWKCCRWFIVKSAYSIYGC